MKFSYLKIRDRAVNYNESTQTVIDTCLNNLSEDSVARTPKFKHINFHTFRVIFCIYEFFLRLFLRLFFIYPIHFCSIIRFV